MNSTELVSPALDTYGYYSNFVREQKSPKINFYILEDESMQSSDDGTESVLSLQGKETDLAKDTSDTDWSSGSVTEYEVVSSNDEKTEGILANIVGTDSSSGVDGDIISISLMMSSDEHLIPADSEVSTDSDSKSIWNTRAYINCIHCKNINNNPMFRFCEKCYKIRKDLFPPRPKRRHPKSEKRNQAYLNNVHSQNSEVTSLHSYNINEKKTIVSSPPKLDFKNIFVPLSLQNENTIKNQLNSTNIKKFVEPSVSNDSNTCDKIPDIGRKRMLDYEEIPAKKIKFNEYDNITLFDNNLNKNSNISKSCDSEIGAAVDVTVNDMLSSLSQPIHSCHIQPISKTLSDPILTFAEESKSTIKQKSDADSDLCIVCLVEPKTGVFVHGRKAHICCCYHCAVEVWKKTKRCPVCKRRVSNVLKAYVS